MYVGDLEKEKAGVLMQAYLRALLWMAGVGSGADRGALVEALEQRQERVRSLSVVTMTRDDHTHGRVDDFVRSELKAWRENLYLDLGHGTDSSPWESDYSRHQTFVAGGKYTAYFPNRRVIEEMALEEVESPERFMLQPFWAAFGWWPIDAPFQAPTLGGFCVDLLSLAHDEEYEMRDSRIEPSGEERWILAKDGHDEIGLDPLRGYALRHRLVREADSEAIQVLLLVDEVRELGGGIWMPTAFRLLYGDGHATDFSKSPPSRTVHVSVEQASIGELTIEDFVLLPAPGTYLARERQGEDGTQLVAGGFDLMESVAAGLHRRSTGGGAAIVVLWAGGALGLLGVLACLADRYRG